MPDLSFAFIFVYSLYLCLKIKDQNRLMLKSLKLYMKYFSKGMLQPERSFILHDLRHYSNPSYTKNTDSLSFKEKRIALNEAINWLLVSQQKMNDDGMGCFHITEGWSSSYPETTGYIIPTLINYLHISGKENILQKATDAANWLLKIQKESGGWQGGKIAENKAEIVFNTAQIIRGMIAIFNEKQDEKYLDSAVEAANWLCKTQHKEGYWKEFALMNQPRVYDSYVDVPLLEVWKLTNDEKYKIAAVKNLEWIIQKKQKPNGWFEDCDNTIKRNNTPILHTIAYTTDGLLNSGLTLNEEKYIDAAKKPADVLLNIFIKSEYLNGRYDKNWQGSEHMMTTGWAQMAGVWFDLFIISKDKRYKKCASRINDILLSIQQRKFKETENTKGAMPGSVPIWGKYEPFAFPNWATKYFADSLIKEIKINASSK